AGLAGRYRPEEIVMAQVLLAALGFVLGFGYSVLVHPTTGLAVLVTVGLEVVCENFQSPLADEFSRTLKEMELGLPRREALQNLKKRTEVPELSNFVL